MDIQATEHKAAIDFLTYVLAPLSKGLPLSVRQFNYMSAITDALGLGTGYFNQLVFRNECDWARIHQELLSHDSFDKNLFDLVASKWNDGTVVISSASDTSPLDDNDLEQWSEQGFVIVKNIISRQQATKTADWLLSLKGILRNDPDSWYANSCGSMMIEQYQGHLLSLARNSTKARGAFEQLWGCKDLVCSVDRTSINLPETPFYCFQGPHLHLDIDFVHPLHFRTQGIVYLNDVEEDQGALTLCTGFHKSYPQWLSTIPEGRNPNSEDFNLFPKSPIAANAGDLIIWHHWLPHGSSPNHNSFPRIAQYMNMYSVEPQLVNTQ